MPFGRERLPGDEVAVDRHLAGKIGMARVDPAVDHRHTRPAPACQLMELGQMPLCRCWLRGKQRIIGRGDATAAEQFDRLRPGHV